MEGKKISFGFMKTKKVEKPVVEEKKDFIECLEEKAIKVVGGEQEEENVPLVIPMKPNTLITAERLKEIAEKVESGLDEVMPVPTQENNVKIKEEQTENLTLDELAVRELMQDAKKEIKVEQQELTVPIPAKPVIDGEKESTLQDYESVPIQDFGMAMLRGMGWTANKEQLAKYKPPTLRPKGLGLGADKVISDKQKKKNVNKDGKEEELAIVKNSYVKIIAGKHSGYYGKVVSLDEDNGRVMVDITMKKETVSLSEFMLQPVTKAEFDKESKVINSGAYEEYKKNESSQNKKSQNESPKASERLTHDSAKVKSREASSSQRSNDVSHRRHEREIKEDSRRDYDKGSNGGDKNRQDRNRRNSSSDDEGRRRTKYSSSEERDSRRVKERSRRDSSSEDECSRRREKPRKRYDNSEERDGRRHKERTRRDSSSSDDRDNRRRKEKSRRNSLSSDENRHVKNSSKSKRDRNNEDRSRRNMEKSRRHSSEERDKRRQEKNKKRYSSNESLESLSESENKKNKREKKLKDSSDSESEEYRKKNKRDIDKKRKGKKKKRDRDRSPNYKKHRK